MASVDTKTALAGIVCGILVLAGCENDSPALSKESSNSELEFEAPDLGPVEAQGPKLGALLNQVPVHERAHQKSKILGYLRAGDQVARSAKKHENDQCMDGWYAISPRGYVCTEKAATIDATHPTLRAMALRPQWEAPLPYTYARTTQVTGLFEKRGEDRVGLQGRLTKNTVMAIVGSWTAPDESGEPQRLGLRMDGLFVRAEDLLATPGSDFRGFSLSDDVTLPIAFVVRRGVSGWSLDGPNPEKRDALGYHERILLTGRYRTISEQRFWEAKDGRWVRHRDVTLTRQRYEFPEFVKNDTKWLDVSVITGGAVAYVGKKPVYATLVSVGRDRLGDPKITASTERGSFRVVRKQVTRRVQQSPDAPLHDAPWAFELENGQWMYAAPQHDRFGIEHTDGNVELAPHDARELFVWAPPELPPGWHGVIVSEGEETLIVNIRK